MDSDYSSPCQINLSAGYAEAFRPVQSDSQTSEWYSYFENDVLDCLRQWNFGLYVSGFWHIHAKTPRGIVVCEP